MHALKVLHKKISDACPFIHQKRLSTLLLATQSLLHNQRLSLTQLGRSLSTGSIVKHNIKRIDRLLGNMHLISERKYFYQFICSELLKHNNRPVIIVDWSDLTALRDRHLLRASVPVGGRTLTIYEEVHTREYVAKHKVHKAFLDELQKLLPKDCTPIIISDAGFRNPWFKAVAALGWDYVGRVRNTDKLRKIGCTEWKHCKTLYDQATTKAQYLGEYEVVRSNAINTHLYLIKKKAKGRHGRNIDGSRTTRGASEKMAMRQREPWLITTSLGGDKSLAEKVIGLYKTRMQIEESFRDMKSPHKGLSLSESLTRNPHRLSVLVLIGSLATLLLWMLGKLTEVNKQHWQYQSSSVVTRRVLSTFYIGCQVAKDRTVRFRKIDYEKTLHLVRA
ncbi:MAG: IS4 family transposase, partial [Gammaproteobacteria bacterium]|nr:IS4 family transposase [Gammaproteobacteria bacterium]